MTNSPLSPQSEPAAEASSPTLPDDVVCLDSRLTLRDGSIVRMRAIRADDMQRLQNFHGTLSADTIIFRFFRVLPELSNEMAHKFTHVDYVNRMALVATVGAGRDERLVAVVRYDRTDTDTAEVAFVVQDAWQGKGIATMLLHRLAEYGRAHGFERFVAITMAANARMLEVLRYAGYPFTMKYVDGDVEAWLDITQAPSPPFASTPSVMPR